MDDSNTGARLMLGTAGWSRADWDEAYYPADLPADWRLAFYANDADCVLLPAAQWLTAEDGVVDAVAEAPGHLTFLLELPERPVPDLASAYAPFDGHPVRLLAGAWQPAAAARPVWRREASTGDWLAVAGTGRVVRWQVDNADLRVLRDRVAGLPDDTVALVLDGPAAAPTLLRDLRTLIDLLGRG